MDSELDLSTIIDGAGPIAGLFVLLVAIALVLLWLNMNRQMKRIDPNLPRGRSEVPIAQESGDVPQMEESAEQEPDAAKQ
jgi:hypothetical protein|tara:strand:+ start:2266 stop:2505 length:240 start_codon:yes stop_codon:yes gene_type:complete